MLLIGCCDSRAAPETIFDAGPGEIFVVRNIANLVPPFARAAGSAEAAAIEYAVIALGIAHIVVMGHARCGGIRAFAQSLAAGFEPLSPANFVGGWKALVAPAAERLGPPPAEGIDGYCELLCQASVAQGIANLRSYPFIAAREEAGDLALHGACFDIADGRLLALDQASGAFAPALAD